MDDSNIFSSYLSVQINSLVKVHFLLLRKESTVQHTSRLLSKLLQKPNFQKKMRLH